MRPYAMLAATAALFYAPAVWAAPATPEQAQTIKTALEKYLGRGTGPEGSAVKVTPDNERYAVDLDLKRLFQPLEALGFQLEPITYRLMLAPQDGGTWRVTNGGTTRMTAKMGDRTFSLAMNGTQFDGVFDPAVPFFTHSTSSYDSLSFGLAGGPGEIQTRDVKGGRTEVTAEKVGDGVITIHSTQSAAETVQDSAGGPPRPGVTAPAAPKFSLKFGPSNDEGRVEGLRIRSLMDLWAFFVAHASEDSIKADREQLRTLVRAALPVLDHISQKTSIDTAAGKTELGEFAVKSAAASLDMNGLVADGQIGSDISLDSLTIPAGLIPSWAEGLLPTRVALKESFSGFHLDKASQEAVNSFDLTAKDPLTPDTVERLKTLVGPLDDMVVTIAPSRLVSRLLDAKFEGRVQLKMPLPDVDVTIRVAGVDTAIKDIQAKAGSDEHAKQLIAVLLLSKGFGKAEADGGLSWHVTSDGAGGFLVNGVALPFGPGK